MSPAELRALDQRIAIDVMGWKWVTLDGSDHEWLSPCTVGRERPSHPQHRWGDGLKRRDLENLPRFSTRIEEAARVEAEIARRGLGAQYVCQLDALIYDATVEMHTPDDVAFALLRATPEQRCVAALNAIARDSAGFRVAADPQPARIGGPES